MIGGAGDERRKALTDLLMSKAVDLANALRQAGADGERLLLPTTERAMIYAQRRVRSRPPPVISLELLDAIHFVLTTLAVPQPAVVSTDPLTSEIAHLVAAGWPESDASLTAAILHSFAVEDPRVCVDMLIAAGASKRRAAKIIAAQSEPVTDEPRPRGTSFHRLHRYTREPKKPAT